jgi:hypothetical protein
VTGAPAAEATDVSPIDGSGEIFQNGAGAAGAIGDL